MNSTPIKSKAGAGFTVEYRPLNTLLQQMAPSTKATKGVDTQTHQRYIDPAGAKSSAGFDSLQPKRRVSATSTKHGAFFVPACFMAALRWETFGSAGFLFGRSVNLTQAATRLLTEALAVPTQKGAAAMRKTPPVFRPQTGRPISASTNTQTAAVPVSPTNLHIWLLFQPTTGTRCRVIASSAQQAVHLCQQIHQRPAIAFGRMSVASLSKGGAA